MIGNHDEAVDNRLICWPGDQGDQVIWFHIMVELKIKDHGSQANQA